MWKKVFLSTLLLIGFLGIQFPQAQAQALHEIEIFDSTQGKVIKKIPNTQELQEELRIWLQSINQLAIQTNIDFRDETVIRIPVEPSVKVEEHLISEMYLIVSPKKDPLMLLFTDENHPLLFQVDHIPVSILAKLGFISSPIIG